MSGGAWNPPNLIAASTLATLALLAAACGGGGSSTPPTVPPVIVQPTPEPVPDPGGGPEASSCPLGPGTTNTSCSSRLGSSHLAEVQGAIDRLVRVRSELFDLEDDSGEGTGQYRVLDRDAYLDAVVGELSGTGLCAQRAYDRQTIQVKDSNDLSEDFDVLTSRGYIRRNAYLTSCQPAAFPVTPGDIIDRVRVAFWGFDCDPGVVVPPKLARELPRGCDGAVTATPKDQDGVDVPPAVHGPDIEWELRHGSDVVKVLPDPRYPNPFNVLLRHKGPVGSFQLCATVQGVEGCLNGKTTR
jgi:hypothetical protein